MHSIRTWGTLPCAVDPTKPTRRERLTIEAVNPEDGKSCEVLISYDRIQFVGRISQGHTKECAELVPMILQSPKAVFEGLLRDEDDDKRGLGWRCYCGIPDKAYMPNGDERPPWPNQVFMVFINRERVAYNWRWEQSSSKDPDLPAEHVPERFKRRLL